MNIFSRTLLQAAIVVSSLTPSMIQASEYLESEQPSAYFDSVEGPSALTNSKNKKIPEFTPFDWSATRPYIIRGTICSNIASLGITNCAPVIFVLDPPKKRFLMDLGDQGKYYMLEHGSYITGTLPSGECAKVLKADGTPFTYDDQVAGYKTAVAMAGSTTKKARFFGLVLDVGSCEDKIAVDITTKNGFLQEFIFTQIYPLPGLGCESVTGVITFKEKSIDTKSNMDPYFVLPANCITNAVPFCSTVFFPGNPCDTCPSCQ